MHNRRYYLGTGFEVWSRNQTWFWFVLDSPGARGTIGAAASAAEALGDACAEIEATAAHRHAGTATARAGRDLPEQRSCSTLGAINWEVSLGRLERYLILDR